MRNALVLLPLMLVASCASLEPRLTCAAGEEPMRTAQLFFGQNPVGSAGCRNAVERAAAVGKRQIRTCHQNPAQDRQIAIGG